jgi:hypothetical protein
VTLAIIVVVVVVVVAVAAFVVSRDRGPADGVDSFRRQIDALSPEARRPVVDQVQSVSPKPIRSDRDEVTVEPDVSPEMMHDARPTVDDAAGRDAVGGDATNDAGGSPVADSAATVPDAAGDDPGDDPADDPDEDAEPDAPTDEDGARGS